MKAKKEHGFEDLKDDSEATLNNIAGEGERLTPDHIKNNKVKKGEPLKHLIYGVVTYRSKIRGTRERIVVSQLQNLGSAELRETRFQVKVADCMLRPHNLDKKNKQPTRMIAAVCPTCDLRIRASMMVYSLGTPLCFNELCEKKGSPLELVIGDDPENPGKMNIDTADRIRVANFIASRGSVPGEAFEEKVEREEIKPHRVGEDDVF